MKEKEIAKALKELGHETRLLIYKRLVRAGHKGIPVGNVLEELQIPGSTLSHHIASLTSADLIEQRREGRKLYCVAKFDRLKDVLSYLMEECCFDETCNEHND